MTMGATHTTQSAAVPPRAAAPEAIIELELP
jgi:hypothetical protein